MERITITFVTLILLLFCIDVSGKPALNEENRNLCESEPDKAECIKEVEDAKATPMVEDNQDESANEKGESKSEEPELTLEEHLEMLERVRRESEESRRFWKEEVRSMNKWERYGLG